MSFSVLQCPYNELRVNGPEDKTRDRYIRIEEDGGHASVLSE
jgi:hypothetical protein